MPDLAAYAGLFFAALLAATMLPGQSEAVLAGLVISDSYAAVALVAVASVGNVAGATINWGMGRGVERFRNSRWFPVSEKNLKRAQDWYCRFGRWSLLLSWMPIVGDALTVVAGIMRERLAIFLPLVAVAKTGRYVVVAAAAAQWL
jgi:membrane protein YqaA with SNARE-associated domain